MKRAIRFGFHSPKVPCVMNQLTLLRALVPSSLLVKLGYLYGADNMMDQYKGYEDGR